MFLRLGTREFALTERALLLIKILFIISVSSVAMVLTHQQLGTGSAGYPVVAPWFEPNPFIPGIIVAAMLTILVTRTDILKNTFSRINYNSLLITIFFFIGWCNINAVGKHNGQDVGPGTMVFGKTVDACLTSFGGVDTALFDSFLFYFSFIGAFLGLFVVISWIYPYAAGFVNDLDRTERAFIVFGGIISLVVISAVFSLSTAYYGSADDIAGTRNLIFTADGSDVANGYYGLGRHPLYFIFSLPLTLFASSISAFAPSDLVYYIMFQWATVFVMMLTILMVVRMLKLNGRMKLFAIVFMSLSYSSMLNSLIIERSVLSAFFIVLTVYLVTRERRESDAGFVGAVGTMSFSLALIPIIRRNREYGQFLIGLATMAAFFFFLLCLSGDLYNLNTVWQDASTNTAVWGNLGLDVSPADVLKIFSVNLFAMLLGPATVEVGTSYLMAPITRFSYIGIAVFVLAVLGFVTNRDDRYFKMCFWWFAVSVLLLVVVGWGAKEGDASLHLVMFSWAYISLMIGLFREVGRRLPEKLTTVMMIAILVPMIVYNILGMYDLVEWSIRVWPR
jgi:hypothetical protein